MLAIGMRSVRAGDTEAALRAFKDAIALEPIGARDDDARLDAAALVMVLAADRGDAVGATAAHALLAEATAATAAFWRGEALTAIAEAEAGAERSQIRRSGAADRGRAGAATTAISPSCARRRAELRAGLRRLQVGPRGAGGGAGGRGGA